MKLKFKVYELVTDKDVTDEREWYIDVDGNLLFLLRDISADIDCPLCEASGEYYYKLEIEVV